MLVRRLTTRASTEGCVRCGATRELLGGAPLRFVDGQLTCPTDKGCARRPVVVLGGMQVGVEALMQPEAVPPPARAGAPLLARAAAVADLATEHGLAPVLTHDERVALARDAARALSRASYYAKRVAAAIERGATSDEIRGARLAYERVLSDAMRSAGRVR